MRHTVLTLLLAASAAATIAQTPAKPAAPAATVHHPAATSSAVKLPPGVPLARGIVKSAFTLRYQDIKIGTGAEAEPNKMYKVQYTGWLGSNGRPDDGHKFDSSYDHPGAPVKDKDGKPVLGDDGKPKLSEPQPMSFPQGMGRLIPGFDQGFTGIKIGGKRRLFIPWQLAYGAKGRPGPDAAHPGIPPKADLIFDVELVEVTDLPMPANHPGMGGMPGGRSMPPGAVPHSVAPGMEPKTPATPGTAPGTAPAPETPSAAPAPPTQSAPATSAPATAPPASAPPAPAAPPTTPPPTQPQSH